jgi:hypothetical protein
LSVAWKRCEGTRVHLWRMAASTKPASVVMLLLLLLLLPQCAHPLNFLTAPQPMPHGRLPVHALPPISQV